MDKQPNKSDKIRQLHDAGLSVAEIAKALGIRYQFAYNVVSYYLVQKEVAPTNASGNDFSSSLRVEHQTAG